MPTIRQPIDAGPIAAIQSRSPFKQQASATAACTLFLDGLRGLAAVYVLLHHARYMLHEGYSDGYLTHPDAYSTFNRMMLYALSGFRWGHEAVLLFFVLSGFVIHLIRPPLETCAPSPCFPILRPLPADGMMRPPDKEAAWMSPNGSVAIGAGLLA